IRRCTEKWCGGSERFSNGIPAGSAIGTVSAWTITSTCHARRRAITRWSGPSEARLARATTKGSANPGTGLRSGLQQETTDRLSGPERQTGGIARRPVAKFAVGPGQQHADTPARQAKHIANFVVGKSLAAQAKALPLAR